MRSRRQILLGWAEQGLIAPDKLHRAMAVAGVFPSAQDWRRFLNHLLLWLGALMLAAGVIYFVAYNWDDLGRVARFAIIEALIAACLLGIWRLGLEGLAGKVMLLVAALFVGALLALIGQTYQTGADTFELFAAWAMLILPWVLVGRVAALWLLWLGLLNLAGLFYYTVFGGMFGLLFGVEKLLWALFALNTLALVVWELLAGRDTGRWALRILATVSGGLVTALAVRSVADFRDDSGLGLLAWAAYFAAIVVVYRRIVLDVYMLAGGVLSLIIVVVTWLAMHLLRSGEAAGALLFIGLVVIGLSGAGGWWLRKVAGGATP